MATAPVRFFLGTVVAFCYDQISSCDLCDHGDRDFVLQVVLLRLVLISPHVAYGPP